MSRLSTKARRARRRRREYYRFRSLVRLVWGLGPAMQVLDLAGFIMGRSEVTP
jgi:hypothetical protein